MTRIVVNIIVTCLCISEVSGDEDDIGLDDVTALTTGKIGTKKMRRLQAKADKKALREVRYPCAT